MKLVRLKPYDPKQGHKLMRLTLSGLNGMRFEAGRWYEVTDEVGAELATCNQNASFSRRPVGMVPRAFDVCDKVEAEELAAEELRVASGQTPMASAHIAPTRDSAEQRSRPATRQPARAPVAAASPPERESPAAPPDDGESDDDLDAELEEATRPAAGSTPSAPAKPPTRSKPAKPAAE